ncbi:MAG: GntR family transcriptional regulator [Alphaproteobacteria bacterium]|mgnify:CR=1 FL=1
MNKNKNRASEISEHLEELILIGKFAEGERLNEIALAEKFGVSRTPIREAFQKLAALGLIEQIPRSGAFIRRPDAGETIELFEAMAEIEASCAMLASRRITNEALQEMRHQNESCRTALENNDVDVYYRENERFHFILYEHSGNKYLCNEAKRLHKRLKPYRRIQLQLRGRMAQSLTEHTAVVNALETGDQQLAAETMRNHVGSHDNRFNDLIANLRNVVSQT